jgi:hypothetical protein
MSMGARVPKMTVMTTKKIDVAAIEAAVHADA